MVNEPRVDVLVPVYNRPELLIDAIESLRQQTWANLRIVVYDDGSTQPHPLPDDSRVVRLRGEVQLGVGHARNQLLKQVRSPLACWQDSDDLSHPDRIARQVRYMLANPECEMLFSWMWFFQHPGPHTRTRTVHRVDTSRFPDPNGFANNFTFATSMFRAALAAQPFPEERRRGGEDVVWVRAHVDAGRVVRHLAEPLYYCRRHPGRLTFQRRAP